VFAPADRPSCRADEKQNESDDQDDDADRPQDGDLEQQTQDQEDRSNDDHGILQVSAARSCAGVGGQCTDTVHTNDDCPWGPRSRVGPVTVKVDQSGWPSSAHD
jgi:hypothetical protein